MLRTLLPLLLAAAPITAVPAELEERQNSNCNRDNLLRCFTATLSVASSYCAAFTPASTITASTFTPSTTITVTETAPTTKTSTVTETSASTLTLTFTSTESTTVTSTSLTTQTSTLTTDTTATLLNKRAAATGPACLTRDGSKSTSYPASRITSACSCLFSQVSVTVTATALTATSTQTVTTVPVVGVTVTQTISTTITQSTTTVSTATFSTTTTTTIISTVTPTQTASFRVAVGPGASCTYNRYTDGFEVDNSPANDYRVGIQQCAEYCADRSECRFFFYLRFDPNRARGADYGFCFIDNLPYDSSYLQCGYPTQKYVGYNKVVA